MISWASGFQPTLAPYSAPKITLKLLAVPTEDILRVNRASRGWANSLGGRPSRYLAAQQSRPCR